MIVIGLGAVLLFFLVNDFMRRRHERKMLEVKHQNRMILEAQRFEKMKEILTNGVIEGSPKALDALKPMVEVMAEQLKGAEATDRMKLAHKQRLEEIEALNEPYRLYAGQIRKQQEIFDYSDETSYDLKRTLDALREANQPFLPAFPTATMKDQPAGTKGHLLKTEAAEGKKG